MDKNKIEEIIKDDGVCLKFRADGVEYGASPQMTCIFDEEKGYADFKVTGYELTFGDTEKVYDSIEKLLAELEGKEIEIVSIGEHFKNLEEYEEDKAFAGIDMEGLLKMYLPDADSFSLTCPYNGGYDKKHPFGIYGITDELAEKALNELSLEFKNSMREQYDLIEEAERSKLPPFDILYKEIEEECIAYRSKHKSKVSMCEGNAFFCDVFARGKAKYKGPERLWHFYHSVDFVETCRFQLDKMKKNSQQRPLTAELDKEEYSGLKNSLIKTEITFSWHCTTSGQLSKVFHFAMNDKTIGWLKGHKNDYDFKELYDLAFYKDGECVFSSCTHEGYHTDLKKK